MIDLICPDCGWEETEPYDIGDGCLCGGVFILKNACPGCGVRVGQGEKHECEGREK